MLVARSTDYVTCQSPQRRKRSVRGDTNGVEFGRIERLILRANEEGFDGNASLNEVLHSAPDVSKRTTSSAIVLTISVVRAEVIRRLLLEPSWGLSSSVMKKIRFVAVFGALRRTLALFLASGMAATPTRLG